MKQSLLTIRKLHEHSAIEYALKSLVYGSIYRGHNNETIYRNIKGIIKDLIRHGYFPKDAYIGRLPFAGVSSLQRAAISVTADYIHRIEDKLTMYALDNSYDPEELIRVLCFCSINAASNGHIDFQSITCLKGFRVLRALPVSVRSGVLQGRYKTVRLFSAV